VTGPDLDLDVPDLGSPNLRAEVRGRVLHLRIDRPERRNAFTQDMYRAIKRAAIWSDDQPALDAVCLTGTFLCIRESARLMVPQAYGRIIAVASRAWQGNPGQANYSAAKAGVVGLTKSVAKELGRHGVTANAVAPGLIDTQSLRELETFDQIAERAIRANSVKRLGQPSDVAAAALYLASKEAGFITGEVIHVSGGRFG